MRQNKSNSRMKFVILSKVILLQVFWYGVVVYGQGHQIWALALSFLLVVLNYLFFRPPTSLKWYALCLLFFVSYGIFQEWSLKAVGLVNYGQSSFPWWLTSLYLAFLCYYGDAFDYLTQFKRPIQILMGGLGGVLAFWSGSRISPLDPTGPSYFLAIFISWAFFFPASLKLYYHGVRRAE
jgi:hypothetical protein